MTGPTLKRLLLIAVAAHALAVLFLVLSPQPDAATGSVRAAAALLRGAGLSAVTNEGVEHAFNAVLLLPLGVLGSLLLPRLPWWSWLVVGLALSLAFEVTQWALLPDRSPSAVDVVTNTAGCVLGAALVALLRRGDPGLRRADRSPRRG
jgi:hypothetical protein